MEMSEGIRTATVEQLQGLILSTCQRVTQNHAAAGGKAELQRIRAEVVDAPYPQFKEDQEGVSTLGPQHTVSISFSLGFLAGMLDDAPLANTYETLLRVLEALGMQGLVYGMLRPSKDNHTGPCFIVQVPSAPQLHLKYEVTLR